MTHWIHRVTEQIIEKNKRSHVRAHHFEANGIPRLQCFKMLSDDKDDTDYDDDNDFLCFSMIIIITISITIIVFIITSIISSLSEGRSNGPLALPLWDEWGGFQLPSSHTNVGEKYHWTKLYACRLCRKHVFGQWAFHTQLHRVPSPGFL